MAIGNYDVSEISGNKKSIGEFGTGVGTGYVAHNDDKNKPIDFNATGNGDPAGYKQASVWT